MEIYLITTLYRSCKYVVWAYRPANNYTKLKFYAGNSSPTVSIAGGAIYVRLAPINSIKPFYLSVASVSQKPQCNFFNKTKMGYINLSYMFPRLEKQQFENTEGETWPNGPHPVYANTHIYITHIKYKILCIQRDLSFKKIFQTWSFG